MCFTPRPVEHPSRPWIRVRLWWFNHDRSWERIFVAFGAKESKTPLRPSVFVDGLVQESIYFLKS